MFVLAIDTATPACSVCLHDSEAGRLLAERSEEIGTGHAERLVPMIGETLSDAGVARDQIGKIAVATGPGSFTGVRVGVAAARGLALALQVPAVGVSCLEALAADALAEVPAKAASVVVDARRGEFWFARFSSAGRLLAGPAVLPERFLPGLIGKNDLLAGSGVQVLSEAVTGNHAIACADRSSGAIGTIARLGMARMAAAHPPVPLYVRKPDAKVQEGFAVARKGSGA